MVDTLFHRVDDLVWERDAATLGATLDKFWGRIPVWSGTVRVRVITHVTNRCAEHGGNLRKLERIQAALPPSLRGSVDPLLSHHREIWNGYCSAQKRLLALDLETLKQLNM